MEKRIEALLNEEDQSIYQYIWTDEQPHTKGSKTSCGISISYSAYNRLSNNNIALLHRSWYYPGCYGSEQIEISRKDLYKMLKNRPEGSVYNETVERRTELKFLGTYASRVVPEAAKNRICQVTDLFSGNDKAAYAIFGVYVIVIAYIGDRWYMKFCTTTHKKGTDQMWERSERISRVLSDLGNSQLKQAIERFMSGK